MAIRIWLSPPDVGPRERELLLDAFDSGWIAPLGPHVDGFEKEIATFAGVGDAAALSSGTAALHLLLIEAGVQPGDEVLVPTMTFAATANVVKYVGATPTFIDISPETWTLNPALLEEVLRQRARAGCLPAAVIPVDLYGQCCDYDPILEICARYEVRVIVDAAESLGASYKGKPAGSLGWAAVFSFNGNKIITTSGGGMAVSDDNDLIARIRYLSTQARIPAPYYQHEEIGYNYRLSNLLAALGRAQLEGLPAKITRRAALRKRYEEALDGVVSFMPIADYGTPNHWLTCVTLPDGVDPESIRRVLAAEGIEARHLWKPMHMQPVFADAPSVLDGTSERLFASGLCLPSGSTMRDQDVDEVASLVRGALTESKPAPR